MDGRYGKHDLVAWEEGFVADGARGYHIAGKGCCNCQAESFVGEGFECRTALLQVCFIDGIRFDCWNSLCLDLCEERGVVEEVGEQPEGKFVRVSYEAKRC